MSRTERLPDDVVDFITHADTVFLGSIYKAKPSDEPQYSSHAGMNARSGLPGFVRVLPSNGRTIVLPDYSGNRFMSSLGNIASSELASLTIVSFTTGDILYLSCQAQVLIGQAAFEIMPRQGVVTVIEPTGYIFVQDALPVRQAYGTDVERSPYSPPIKYLHEEKQHMEAETDSIVARLSSATLFADDIATLRFNVTYHGVDRLKIKPGQAIALNFMDWMGEPEYQHMAANTPWLLNDDRVRTWTVSRVDQHETISWFDLTMREKKGGIVTTALFNVIRKYAELQGTEADINLRGLEIDTPVAGITGEFDLPDGALNILLVAGGIGITPFLAMLAALYSRGSNARGDVVLALSTREPDVFLRLIKSVFSHSLPNICVRVEVFTNELISPSILSQLQHMQVFVHRGRIPSSYWKTVAHVQNVYICGPSGFADAAVDGLRAVGIADENIFREGFY